MRAGRRGYTLLEILIVAAISAVVFAAVFSVIFATVRQDEGLRVRMEMQIEATRAMKEISSLLKQSGPLDVNRDGIFAAGSDWPVFSSDTLFFHDPSKPSMPTPPLGSFPSPLSSINSQLTAPYKLTLSGDPRDFPENQASSEIAFRIPVDTDGDGHATDASGNIEWSTDVYVICHEARSPVEWIENGNVLELRRYTPNGAGWDLVERKILAHWVERVLFESKSSQFYQTGNYDPTLGFDQLRMTIWFRRNDISRQRERQLAIKQSSTVLFRSVDR